MPTTSVSSIEKTPGVCGGAARIANHRIKVAHLIWYRKRGMANERLLEVFPTLTEQDLEAAWNYYHHNTNEIEREIWFNDTAGNIPEGTSPPSWVIVAGLRLGIPEAEVRDAFEPPLAEEHVTAAWEEYWRNPAGVEEDIGRYRSAG